MAKSVGRIRFEPRPLNKGPQWQVLVTYPDGTEEHIIGFVTESDARNWITSDSEAWLKELGFDSK
jgi:hypothetical protein